MTVRSIDTVGARDDDLQGDRVLLTGLQALVHLLLIQSRRDRAAGLNTAGFVSGYRGSPLGGLDLELWRASKELGAANIRFEPGLNEELAATAIWGSQQANLFDDVLFDGVFGLWYGKGPGVDRSGDALKHGNSAGASRFGGVLVAAGDDHACKSSTLAQQSEYAFMDAMMPVLNPSDVSELIELGLLGYALSRYSGCWVGFIVTQETADAAQTFNLPAASARFVQPSFELPVGGLNIRWPDAPLEQEHRLHNYKLAAAMAFARANRADRIVRDAPAARVGVAATGKAYGDLMKALTLLGIDERRGAELGLRVLKIGMSWPLEPETIAEFADGLEEIIVVEEKRGLVESQTKELLFSRRGAAPPVVVGKCDDAGAFLLPTTGELTPGVVARALAKRLSRFDSAGEIGRRADRLASGPGAELTIAQGGGRMPHFCSGCPHNTSTRVPEGSRAAAGIGCHFMALWMDRSTVTFAQMGGEGVTWIGQAPFVTTEHMFQNLGDGTYTHSGLLAIRAAVAAKVNITYKILYNDAVAMTGGQPVEGSFTPAQIAQQLIAEGVGRVVIVTDHPGKYAGHAGIPAAVNVFGREEFDRVQRQLREHKGVSALIYDQACAAETRRKRKRGLAPTPERRVVINDLVCEGCGDCNEQSNCLSVLPLETEFGRKRTIDQSACNRDYSCLDGFCPSFVTLRGAAPKQRNFELPPLPAPKIANQAGTCNIVVAGIGGTGVVTVGKLLGLAAHREGKAVTELAQTGLAQKFGAVLSHVRIAESAAKLDGGPRVAEGQADVFLASDLLVAASQPALTCLAADRSVVVANCHHGLPPAFIHERDLQYPAQALLTTLKAQSCGGRFVVFDATLFATELLGDAMLANVVLLGAALQHGLLPVSATALDDAFEELGASADVNRRALALGRYAAHDPAAVAALCARIHSPELPAEDLDTIIARRKRFLTGYQDDAYAARYEQAIARIRAKETRVDSKSTALTQAVARQYFRLLAYKDEYEVARLYSETGFLERLHDDYEGPLKISLHLAPPLFRRVDPISGRPRKVEFGPWILSALRVLARMRFLRGGMFDVFGYSQERKMERRLLREYEQLLARIETELDVSRLPLAVALAEIPSEIRGFGPVKAASAERAAARRAELLRAWEETPAASWPRPARVAR